MSGMTRPRRGADALTRLTAVLAGIFFVTSLSLAILAKSAEPAKDILQLANEASKAQPADAVKNEVAPVKAEATKEAVKKSDTKNNKKAAKPKAPISK